MATTNATPDLAVKSENVQYERWSKITMSTTDPTKAEKVETSIVSNPSEDDRKKLQDAGYTLEFSQTVRVDKAGTWDGCASIIKDEDERVIVYNRGLMSKLNQKLNALFKETNEDGSATFQSTEEIYDPTELVNDPTQRKSLTPMEKAIKGLEKAGIPAEALAAAIAALQAAQAGS